MSCFLRSTAILLFAAMLAIPLTSAVRAQAKRPMAIDDLITAVRVGEPDVSPDGRQVIFVRTTTALDTGRRNADIWSVPADGSAAPSLLVGGEKAENAPRFLPDGKRFVFISSRDGAPQVYVADADGRNVKAITRLSGGVQSPLVVSPDGRRVAFVSDVYPPCADEDCNRAAREAIEHDPVKMR